MVKVKPGVCEFWKVSKCLVRTKIVFIMEWVIWKYIFTKPGNVCCQVKLKCSNVSPKRSKGIICGLIISKLQEIHGSYLVLNTWCIDFKFLEMLDWFRFSADISTRFRIVLRSAALSKKTREVPAIVAVMWILSADKVDSLLSSPFHVVFFVQSRVCYAIRRLFILFAGTLMTDVMQILQHSFPPDVQIGNAIYDAHEPSSLRPDI